MDEERKLINSNLRVIIDYILHYGVQYSIAVRVASIILNYFDKRSKPINTSIENEILKSNVFLDKNALILFNSRLRQKILDIIKSLQVSDVILMMSNDEMIRPYFGNFFRTIDTSEEFQDLFTEDFIANAKEYYKI